MKGKINKQNIKFDEILFSPQVPSISVIVSDNTSGIAGESYALNCRVLGTENLHPSITYQWMKSTSSGLMQVGTNSTLSFRPIRLSDAANYSCIVIIASGYLVTSITAMASHSIRIKVRRFQKL